ncbi:hypothetical protein L6164_024767 [Bauhinia variegata]|uniref:Uncharacterized protein n=1 Tax=Bauhinia variegata TaxID=167791 RepID=A0ACB9LYJ3_BAUVA|nr:hypothetical protein L6164_024767 [Bauhinia variegata]
MACFCVIFFFLLGSCALTNATDTETAILIVVDQSGMGDFQKIQDAIDAVPSNNSQLFYIQVNPGIYKEKILVPADKPFITLGGTNADNTIISWNDSSDIFQSPTFTVLASDFLGRQITIQNSYGSGAKAVALRVSGDRVRFSGCRILSHQDTLLDDTGRHYYTNCYIEGDVDFIFGNAASLYERCHLHSLSKENGAITAQSRGSAEEDTGFVFLGCKITGVNSGTALLGRPWGPYARVVFAYTYMSSVILPQGWDDWGDSSKQETTYLGQYRCYGPGAKTGRRVPWSHTLTAQEAEPFMSKDLIDGKTWIRSAPTKFRRFSYPNPAKIGGR